MAWCLLFNKKTNQQASTILSVQNSDIIRAVLRKYLEKLDPPPQKEKKLSKNENKSKQHSHCKLAPFSTIYVQ